MLLEGNSGRIWGVAYKSTNNNKDPVMVTIGHKISLESMIALMHKCCKFKVPEPVRAADLRSRELIRKTKSFDELNPVSNQMIFLYNHENKVEEEKREEVDEKVENEENDEGEVNKEERSEEKVQEKENKEDENKENEEEKNDSKI